MRVALTGPACAGKSTLLKNLERILTERRYKVKVFNEIARDYIKLDKDTRVVQAIFYSADSEGMYSGKYQAEGL